MFLRDGILWSLAAVLLLAAVSPPLQACDGGTVVPDPGNNPGLVEDCKVLLALRDELADTGSLNWDTQLAITSWEGVGVSGAPRRVSKLELYENQLTGSLPAELGRLTQLQRLELFHHQLTGAIPPELGQLTQLQYLDLSSNQLTGAIPVELSQLTQLQSLYLSHNQLMGGIPPELGQLTRLGLLWLQDNQLTGEIPVELGQLSQMTWLSLDGNQLTGEIPVELGQLIWLGGLRLQTNQLTGWIPPALGQLTQLRVLRLDENQLTGAIPVELGRLTNLQALHLSENQLTGAIPGELGQLTQLANLDLSHNRLIGSIPVELGRLTGLWWIDLRENQLTGGIPVELAQLTQLGELLLSGNQLTGAIPVELAQLTQLRVLDLSHNRLTGPIPVELGRLTQLKWLRLQHNQLTGEIPEELGQLTRLQRLWLNNNQLMGGIPMELGHLTNLWELHLQHNQLTGAIPVELGRLIQLQAFSFRDNQLTGPVPPTLRHLPDVYVLNLVGNWVGPGRMHVTWDEPGDSTASYTYRLWEATSGSWTDWAEILETTLRAGEGVTIEWTLTGLPTDSAYTYISVRARNRSGFSPEARARVGPLETPVDTPEPEPRTVLLAHFANGNNTVFNSRVYLFNPSVKTGRVTVRVFTLPLMGGLAQELTTTPLELGSLGPKSGLNIKLVEDILTLLGITTPYTIDGGNLTLELTILAPDVRGTAQVFTSGFGFGTYPLQEIPSTSAESPTVLVANFTNGNNAAFNSRVYLWHPSTSSGEVTVRVFTLPLGGGLAQELTLAPLALGTLGARAALNVKLAENILNPLGVSLPYTTDGGNLTLEFTIQAADVKGAAQVFSSGFAFGTQPLQEIPSTSSGSPTVLVANFMNGNSDAFSSRAYLFNPSDSDGNVTVRVFTLPLSEGTAQELTGPPLDLGTLEARSALNLKLVEDILIPLGIALPYVTDGGNLTLEFTIQAADARGVAQVFSSDFAFGTYPMQEIPSTSSESPTVLVANFMNGNDAALNSRVYLWNPSLSAGSVTVRVFTLPLTAGVAQDLTTAPLDLGTLGAESARNLKLVEDILTPLGIPTPYVTDGGNLTLEFTIQAADARGVAQVFSSDFAFGTVPLQVIR